MRAWDFPKLLLAQPRSLSVTPPSFLSSIIRHPQAQATFIAERL